MLEERKNEMTQIITRTQEEKLEHVRSLMKKYADHLEAVSKLVESGIQFMEEPEMAVFLQVYRLYAERGKERWAYQTLFKHFSILDTFRFWSSLHECLRTLIF